MTKRRTGDTISIKGEYQYNAFYGGNPVQRFWHYAKYSEAEKQLNVKENDFVLDVGCGSGVLSHQLAEKYANSKITGIDGNSEAIQFCSNKYNLSNLHFLHGFVDELNFKEESIQKILFLEVIEHIYFEQGLEVLKKFHQLLAKNGLLVVSTPNYNSFWPLIEIVLDKLKLVPQLTEEQHVAKYTGKKLREVAESAGFTCISWKSVNFIAPWMNLFSNSLSKKIHRLETKTEHNLGSVLVYTFKKV